MGTIMFRNLKLKNTFLCELAFLFEPAILVIAALLAHFFIPNENVSVLVWGSCLAASFVIFILRIKTSFSADIILTNLRLWKKDRLSFETDINGASLAEVEKAITTRALKWGKSEENQNGAVMTCYKKVRTLSDLPKIVHQKLVIYTAPTLTYEDYSAKLEKAKKEADTLTSGKKDEESAVAVIFLCERAEQSVLDKVRADCDYTEHDNIVLPLVYDAFSKKYYFNALYEYLVFIIMTTKNYLLNSIKKVVFGGKLPLENNDRFDYSNEISVWYDKTLGELLDDIKETDKKDKQFVKDTAEQLSDGQVLYHDESLYLKHKGKLASYLVVIEEDKPDDVYLWDVDIWDYPNQTDISKKDQEALKKMATDYFATQGKRALFDIEE